MAASEIRTKVAAEAAFDKTLASLAATGAQQTTLATNGNSAPAALVSVRLKSGGVAPTAGKVYEIYLLRNTGTIADDNAGATKGAITIENAPLLGTIAVTAHANKSFYGIFDTGPLGPLGPTWGVAIKNATDQALSATESDHAVLFSYYVPEAQ